MVAQFHSGTEDLYRNTRDLLLFNRKRIEELAVQREKQVTDSDHFGNLDWIQISSCE